MGREGRGKAKGYGKWVEIENGRVEGRGNVKVTGADSELGKGTGFRHSVWGTKVT